MSQVRDYPQINVRVPPEIGEVLEAARYVRGHTTTQDLVRAAVMELAARLASEEPVKRALQAREMERSRSEGGK